MKIEAVTDVTHRVFQGLNRLEPVWWLILRVWIAAVFFKSGLVKIDDFETTVLLFAEEYKVPLLPPMVAAIFGTFFELICPVFLSLGLATRFAAVPLLVMTAVIQFTYMDHVQHYYWALVLAGIILHGPGQLSVDALLARRLKHGLRPLAASP